jgi:DNA-binding NtrC family response regulator
MKDKYTILIADRNSHVRKFLQREMTAAGYQVRLAENAREVLWWAFHNEPLDIIILDPDLHDADEEQMLQNLLARVPGLPIIIHTYPSEYYSHSHERKGVFFVEKKGNSVELLKRVVYDTLVEPPYHQQNG